MEGVLWCLAGLVALIAGSNLLVRQATSLAGSAGVPPILIGLTVVAVGTSTPELAVGIDSSLQGLGSLAVGNVAGANIINILLTLGFSALLRPLPLQMRTVRYDLPVAVGAAGLLWLMALDGALSRPEGLLLLAGAVAYTAGVVVFARRESARTRAQFAEEFPSRGFDGPKHDGLGVLISLVLLAVSIVIVVKGADWLVHGASGLAMSMGVSEALVGLTIVAVGTSLPELVTTIVSTIRNDRDVALGTLMGSCIYNILLILGSSAAAPGQGIVLDEDLLWIGIPACFVATLACIPVFTTGRRVSRAEGGIFVAAYLIYLGYLVTVRG